ncbi:MAG: hypothetical protein L6V90_11135 [Treponema succinifaciens]|nr:MAG: hypothetical protein L6V90_11135 [Treponema succinifaciens]
MAKKYVWSIVLRPNPFTQDNDRDQLADVVPAAAKRDEDIADAIVAEGSEIKKETILNILSLRNKKSLSMLFPAALTQTKWEAFRQGFQEYSRT